jgi:hypothetical protein
MISAKATVRVLLLSAFSFSSGSHLLAFQLVAAWLKAKGDDFYRSRDYRSAVNAYSEAVSVADKHQTDLLTA